MALAIYGFFLHAADLDKINLPFELCKPGGLHWLGCDVNGRDIFQLLCRGANYSLLIAISSTLCALAVGVIVGSMAALYGKWVDGIFLIVLETILAFPGTLLAIGIAALLGPSVGNLIFILSFTGWTSYARVVRAGTLSLKHKEFIEAARALGLSPPRIFLRHILPNLSSSLLVLATFSLGGNILVEASLSFLGIGLPPDIPSWGALLNSGREVLFEAPHVSTFPGLAIIWTLVGFHLVGEGLRELWNPRLLENIQ